MHCPYLGLSFDLRSLLIRRHDNDILKLLVTELEILLNGDGILDLGEDDRRGDDQRDTETSPCSGEDGVERLAKTIHAPEDGSAGGLNTLVETCIAVSVIWIRGWREEGNVPAKLAVLRPELERAPMYQ